MGVYMAEPITTKAIKEGKGKDYSYCMSEMQGWRKNMEDASICNQNIEGGNSLFAVFDGHGGRQVSKYVQKQYINILVNLKSYKNKQYQKALVQSFKLMDQKISSPQGQKQLQQLRGNDNSSFEKVSAHTGCTANVLLMTQDSYIVANAGDSRSALSRSTKKVDLSFDHKPQSQVQQKRIKQAGGQISMGRVNGGLNLTRSLGDFDYKQNKEKGWQGQMITSCPDVKTQKRNKKQDEFIIMGCDGIWQKFVDDSQGLLDLVSRKIGQGKTDVKILEEVLNQLLAKDTTSGFGCDNMTSILIRFNRN